MINKIRIDFSSIAFITLKQFNFNLKCRVGFSARFIDVQPSTVIAGHYPDQDVSQNKRINHTRPFSKKYESYPKEWYGSVVIEPEQGDLND